MKNLKYLLIPLGVIAFIVFCSAFYTVAPNTSALVVKLGKVQYVETNPGGHFKTPFIEKVSKISTRTMITDIAPSDVITADKKSMIADDYVLWYITDPVKYYQTLNSVRGRADERIEAAVYNATKNTISAMTQDEIIAARGTALTDAITEESNTDIGQYGITIKRAAIKVLDLPDDNKQAVYERMISERENIAASYTAKGSAEAQKIRNDTDKQTSVTKANAKAEAAKLEAEGEAEYMRILSDAYNNPSKAEFYNFMRSLDSLKAFATKNKTLILDKDSEYAQLLYGVMN